METQRRYCPECDDDTLQLRSGPKGFFYGCINFTSAARCGVTQATAAEPFHRPGYNPEPGILSGPVEYSLESKVAQAQTRHTIHHGITELDLLAAKRGMASCADIDGQLRGEIPGFGKAYDDLTDEERHAHADVLGPFLATAIRRMINPLPYDKTTRVADSEH
jgi:hypothetical protein